MIYLENDNLEELIKDKKVVIDFYASWCGPCKMFGPVFESVSLKRDDVTFIKIDIDKFRKIASQYKIMSVPTIVLIDNNVEIKRVSGFMNEGQFNDFLG